MEAEAATEAVKKPAAAKIISKALTSSSWAFETAMLPLSMILVQVLTMVTLLICKLALNSGMRPFVFLVYRNLIAAAAVAPLALIFEREMLKQVSLVIWGWISVNAALGIVLAMGLYYHGLRATSAAYSVNFLNLIPIITFIIAIMLRAEKLMLTKWPGRMKLLGTVMCVCGAMVASLFKGRRLHLWATRLLRSHATATSPAGLHHGMVAGTLFLCGSCLSYALWFIVQARLAKVFPSKYLVTTLTCLLGSLQCFVVGISLGHSRAEWKLKWDLQLLTVVYSGVFNTGVTYVLISWVISRRGPIYPSMFSPLLLIITTAMDSLLLGTNIYLGSVLGTMLIFVGLYAFLWGKGKELQLADVAAAQKPAAGSEEEAQEHGGDDMA
ncbi:WAT1-related protein At5g64700-like [Panicum hallii]|uniref:WAT1-related protein At5g64700-like n=1 Tax=Panicum hallii TaxID=206008 RepID=UPI000DF4D68B|nr:WAT1-related protein At5g64700-like [Panicum hallii]